MPRLSAASLSVVLVALVVLAAWTGEPIVVAAAVGIVQLLVAAAPGSPGAGRGTVTGPRFTPTVVAAVVASAVAVRPSVLVGPDGPVGEIGHVRSGVLAGVLLAVAAGLVVALVGQMLRRGGRPQLVHSLGLSVTLVVLAALASGWVGSVTATGGPEVVTICAAALAAGAVAWAVPGDRALVLGLVALAGAAGGAAAALVVDGLPTWLFGVAVGSTVAVVGVAGQAFGSRWAGPRLARPEGWGFAAACSVALVGPVAHLAAQLVSSALV